MNTNNIISTPCLPDAEAAYSRWEQSHAGSRSDFFRFITTPSVERDVFLLSLSEELKFEAPVVLVQYSTLAL